MVVAVLACIVPALERPASDSATRMTTGGTASPSARVRRILVASKSAHWRRPPRVCKDWRVLVFCSAPLFPLEKPVLRTNSSRRFCFRCSAVLFPPPFAYADAPVGDFAFQTLAQSFPGVEKGLSQFRVECSVRWKYANRLARTHFGQWTVPLKGTLK